MVVTPTPESFTAGMKHGRVGGSTVGVAVWRLGDVKVKGVDAGTTLVIVIKILVMARLAVDSSMPYIRIDGGDGLRLVGSVADGEVESVGAIEAEDIGIVVDIGT